MPGIIWMLQTHKSCMNHISHPIMCAGGALTSGAARWRVGIQLCTQQSCFKFHPHPCLASTNQSHPIPTKNHKRVGGFLKWWYPQIIHFHRVFGFSIINHPFWGTTWYHYLSRVAFFRPCHPWSFGGWFRDAIMHHRLGGSYERRAKWGGTAGSLRKLGRCWPWVWICLDGMSLEVYTVSLVVGSFR